MKKLMWFSGMVAAAAVALPAQTIVRPSAPLARVFSTEEPNAPRIGVYLGENSLRDTLGVLINSVIKDGPADNAGLKEGDRIAAIDGVNLKMAREDADDPSLQDMMGRRLTRTLDKHKAGDEIEFRVYSGGSTKSVRIKTVAARDLDTEQTHAQFTPFPARNDDRAALGLNVGGSVTKRDTLGLFVTSVAPDGPAEKAGIVEGERIARINGVDLRVQGPDAGESDMSRAMYNRLTRELGKLKAGDVATLSVVSAGRTRDVRVTTAKASEVHQSGMSYFFGDGRFLMQNFDMPQFRELLQAPGVRSFKVPDGGGVYYWDGSKMGDEIRAKLEQSMVKARAALEDARVRIGARLKDSGVFKVKPTAKIIKASR